MEPRVEFFATQARHSAFRVSFKFAVCYAMIGLTNGINSTYYLILLLPVVSAATTSTVSRDGRGSHRIAILSYLSFLLPYIDWSESCNSRRTRLESLA